MPNAYDFFPHGDSRHYWYHFFVYWRIAPVRRLQKTSLEKNRLTDFAESKCFLQSALISERIKIQDPAWSQLIDFSKMQILKKRSSHCDQN